MNHLVLQRERQSKTRQGTSAADFRKSPKLPELIDQPDRCPVVLFQKFIAKRPPLFNSADSPLFVRPSAMDPRLNFDNEVWFNNQRMGLSQVTKITQRMVSFSTLETSGRNISNTSFRKCLGSTLLRNNIPPATIMSQMGHRNPNSMARYDCTASDSASKVDIL